MALHLGNKTQIFVEGAASYPAFKSPQLSAHDHERQLGRLGAGDCAEGAAGEAAAAEAACDLGTRTLRPSADLEGVPFFSHASILTSHAPPCPAPASLGPPAPGQGRPLSASPTPSSQAWTRRWASRAARSSTPGRSCRSRRCCRCRSARPSSPRARSGAPRAHAPPPRGQGLGARREEGRSDGQPEAEGVGSGAGDSQSPGEGRG